MGSRGTPIQGSEKSRSKTEKKKVTLKRRSRSRNHAISNHNAKYLTGGKSKPSESLSGSTVEGRLSAPIKMQNTRTSQNQKSRESVRAIERSAKNAGGQ